MLHRNNDHNIQSNNTKINRCHWAAIWSKFKTPFCRLLIKLTYQIKSKTFSFAGKIIDSPLLWKVQIEVKIMETLVNNPIRYIFNNEVWLFLQKNLLVCRSSISKASANGLLTLIDHNLGIQSLIILKTARVSWVLENHYLKLISSSNIPFLIIMWLLS